MFKTTTVILENTKIVGATIVAILLKVIIYLYVLIVTIIFAPFLIFSKNMLEKHIKKVAIITNKITTKQ